MYMKADFLRFLMIVLVQTVFTLSEAKVYLVSVGISDYPGSSNDLILPAKDAQTISWLYSKNADTESRQLTDTRATVQNIISAMRSVFTKAATNDIVVFFFSGHGYKGGFAAYDGSLSYEKIRKAMAASKCRNKMIFADACYSGKIRTNGSQNSVQSAKKANVMLFLSSRSDETSIEIRNMQNGLFTDCLQKGLRGGADANRDRIITAKELYNYVHSNVVNISNGRQHPVMWGRFSNNMSVMKWNKR